MGYTMDVPMHQISSPPSFHTSMNKLIDSPQVVEGYTICKCQKSILQKDRRKHDIGSESSEHCNQTGTCHMLCLIFRFSICLGRHVGASETIKGTASVYKPHIKGVVYG